MRQIITSNAFCGLNTINRYESMIDTIVQLFCLPGFWSDRVGGVRIQSDRTPHITGEEKT
jgi:hypothetical protein